MKGYLKALLTVWVLILAALVTTNWTSQPTHATGLWYVSPDGNDSYDCLSPTTACATINGALNKPGFVAGDMVRVATGTYTDTGDQVVLLDKDTTLSGGWDTSFTVVSGTSVLNGGGMRRGVHVTNDAHATLERFSIQNGYAERGAGVFNQATLVLNYSTVTWNRTFAAQGGGICNNGTLTLNHSVVSNNSSAGDGGGIFHWGTLTLNNSTIQANSSLSHAGGIWNDGTLIVNNSTINDNQAAGYGGGISNNGTLTLINSTVSGNGVDSSTSIGGGIMNWGNRTAALYNSTVSANSAADSGGGLYNSTIDATLTIQNSLIANNTASMGPDCWGNVTSDGYNLLGDTSGCSFTPDAGDLTNTNANLGRLTGSTGAPLYHPLLPDSPAIDAGDPAGCKDSQGNPLAADQRGVSRVGRCDIGAYEYTTPGPAASVHAIRGTPQHTRPLSSFLSPFEVSVLDAQGSPVKNVGVVFLAPQSGSSGIFTDTGAFTTTAISDLSGIATAAIFTANEFTGSYVVTATVDGVVSYASFLLTNTKGWYVAPGDNDSHSCLLPDAPCTSINSALGRATPGDRIFVTQGVYTGTGREVLLILKDIALSGGWNASFSSQNGVSTIDGQGARTGIWIIGANATIERFVVRNGYSEFLRGAVANSGTTTLSDSTISGNTGGGIDNSGIMAVNNSTISDNNGSGIWNEGGTFILNNCSVSGNRSDLNGGGIHNIGTMTLNNCTVSDNTGGAGGGAHNTGGTLYVNNSTFYDNSAVVGGGIYIYNGAQATIRNSILAGNTASSSGPDCEGSISSGGYNLIGNTSGCNFTPAAGDLLNVNPRLFRFIGSPGYHPLLPGSPAIDAGNPAGCADHLDNLITTDQHGTPRPLDGDGDGNAICDIGAYEVDPDNPIRQVFLPIIARNYCPDFFDDFSNPASGWEVGEDEYVRTEYLNGEYRILTKQGGYIYLFRAPTCHHQNYVVEVDTRWVGTPGLGYGLIFGVTNDFSQFYLFNVNTDYQVYWLLRSDPNGWVTLADLTYSPAIHSGAASNHFKVTRNGSQITLEVNGTVLGTWQDSAISGLTGAGLASSPYDDAPVSDARFDNFRVTSLTSGTMQQSLVNTSAEGSQVIPQGFPKVATFNNQ